jgi:hypothetical protein
MLPVMNDHVHISLLLSFLNFKHILFNMLNPFMHLEMQFKQQKIVILSRFTTPNAGQKNQKVELLAKPINKVNNHFPLKMNHLSQ